MRKMKIKMKKFLIDLFSMFLALLIITFIVMGGVYLIYVATMVHITLGIISVVFFASLLSTIGKRL